MGRKQRKWSIQSVVKEYRPFVKRAIEKGWTPRMSGTCHTILVPPAGSPHTQISMSMSPSDRFALKKMTADLRRAGILDKDEVA